MSSDVQESPNQTAASLVSGILSDLQLLVEQQFRLTRREIEEELLRRGHAASIIALGAAVLFLDVAVFCLALIHLLHWMTSPPRPDAAWLPLWGCHAVVGGGLLVVAVFLIAVGRIRFTSIESCQNPVADLLQDHVP